MSDIYCTGCKSKFRKCICNALQTSPDSTRPNKAMQDLDAGLLGLKKKLDSMEAAERIKIHNAAVRACMDALREAQDALYRLLKPLPVEKEETK